MSINLLPSEAKFQTNRIHFRKKVIDVSYVLGGLWLGGLIIVYIIWLVYRQINLGDQKKLEVSTAAYNQLSSHLITNQELRYRLKLVSSILDKRFEYSKAFRTIVTLFPPPVSIDNFNLNEDGTFYVKGSVIGHQNMDQVETELISINNGDSAQFKSATLKQLSVDGENWTFSLEVVLK